MASLQIRNPGISVSRADAIRNLIELGLEISMTDRREEIRGVLASLAYIGHIDSTMATEHGAPMMNAGISPSALGILNGYLSEARKLCPESKSIQQLQLIDEDALYGQYLTLQDTLRKFLRAELNTRRRI